MSFNLGHIWSSMSPLSKGIFFCLLIMAIACVAVTVDRLLAFARSSKESRLFAAKVAPLIQDWKVDEVAELCGKYKASNLARLFGFITRRYIDAYADLEGGLTPVEISKNEAERRKEQVGADLRRGMNVLATVGSIAPFVGLLGTVVGIIAAFQGIASTGSGGIGAVSAGIAEALVETAFGLMTAIPAVIMFNYLTAKVASIELALGRSVGELLDEMENNYGRSASDRRQAAA